MVPAMAVSPESGSVTEGTIPFHGSHSWYRVIGRGEGPGKLPVLCLHGGPGASWDYLEPLEGLARGRRVVFYDQIGSGNSPFQPVHDPSMWSVELFVEEVQAVRDALGLGQVHLLGQSWGGMLAMAYALTEPPGLRSLILESSPASIPGWLTELDRLRSELPREVEEGLRAHEAAGTTESPRYQELMEMFYRRHVCRLDPWPEPLVRTFAKLEANPEVYRTMNGPSEFHVIGVIRDFDITDSLGAIRVPTLLMSGRYDEVTPATVEVVQRGIPGSRWVVFDRSSHTCHLEETDAVLATASSFLEQIEGEG